MRKFAVVALSLISIFAGSMVSSGASGASTTNYPIGNLFTGLAAEAQNPNGTPPGANIFTCKTNSQHPYPVILLHGTAGTATVSWQALAPMLANAGYCVYAYNYGATSYTFGYLYGLGDITQSAKQLADVVRLVLASTGAQQVDIVGHSQGGMMPRYYINDLGGASKVHVLVGLAPSNHGTTLFGITQLEDEFAQFGPVPTSYEAGIDCAACFQQVAGSAFLTALNGNGDTVPGPRYVVIESEYDEVVTPYQLAFLSGPSVDNITLQDQCPDDFSEHLGILYDAVALQDVMNALGRDSSEFQPVCSVVLPGIGSFSQN